MERLGLRRSDAKRHAREDGHPVLRSFCGKNSDALEYWVPAFAGTTPRFSRYAPTCLNRCTVGRPSMNAPMARPSDLKYSVLRCSSTAASLA
jgi:hypothetical protein